MGKVINISGMKFGRLYVIERAENTNDGKAKWRCRCDCGNETTVIGKLLRTGHTKSCGCINKEIVTKTQLKDLVGKQFGKLTVVSRGDDYVSPRRHKHHVRWNCVCECGNKTLVSSNQLLSGKTKSCGCLRTGNLKHGGRRDRLYGVYANMKDRCYNKNNVHYSYYGGRGVTICEEWLSSYAVFKEWAYKNGYDDSADYGKCTIDRIDVDKGYSPNNCRWVDMKVQSNNRRNVINRNNDKCPREDNSRAKT